MGPPPGPGTLRFVPKDVHAAVTTICSLAEHEPARAPVPLHRLNAGTRVTLCVPCPSTGPHSKGHLPGTLKTPLFSRNRGYLVPPAPPCFQLCCLQLSSWHNTRFDLLPRTALFPSLHGQTNRRGAGSSIPKFLSSYLPQIS